MESKGLHCVSKELHYVSKGLHYNCKGQLCNSKVDLYVFSIISLLFVGGILYTTVPIWACWLVFVGATGASMIVMLSMVKWLERVAK